MERMVLTICLSPGYNSVMALSVQDCSNIYTQVFVYCPSKSDSNLKGSGAPGSRLPLGQCTFHSWQPAAPQVTVALLFTYQASGCWLPAAQPSGYMTYVISPPVISACDVIISGCDLWFCKEVDEFCNQFGIPLSLDPIVPSPRSPFFLNVIEYYRLSICQMALVGIARIMHFEITCRALGHEPDLLVFRRFFQLAKNGNWFTIEKTQVENALVSSQIGLSASWKDRFFLVSDEIVPFAMPWRKPEDPLNEKVPSVDEVNEVLLEKLRSSASRLRTFPEEFLVKLGLSGRWSDPHMEPSMFVDDEVVRVFDCMLLEDFSVVKFKASVVPPGATGVVLRTKACRHYLRDAYESVVGGSSSKIVVKPSVSVRRSSTKQLTLPISSPGHEEVEEVPQVSGLQGLLSSDPVDDVDPAVEMDPLLEISGSVIEGVAQVGEFPSVKKGGKKLSAKGKGKAVEDSPSVPVDQDPDVDDIYIPDWQVGVHDTFSKTSVCREAIHGFAPPAERARNDCLENVELLKKFFSNGARFMALVPEITDRLRDTYKDFTDLSAAKVEVDKISSERAESIRKLTIEKEGLTTKLSALQSQVASDREELEAGRKELEAGRKELKSGKAAATRAMEENRRMEETNKWLVEEGLKQVVTYLLNSAEFKEPLSMIYMKALAYGRHQGLLSGYTNCLNGVPKEACKEYKPDAAGEFANSVKALEITSYPFLQALSGCSGQPLSFLQSLEPKGLSKEVADRVLGKKRPAPTLLSQDQAGLPAVSLKRLKVAEKNVDEVLKDLGTPMTPAGGLASEDLTPVKSSSEAAPSDADSPEDVAAPGFPAPGDSLDPQ
ncbi:hypothetical protein QVD17_20128 [Tagetes erecta]|uniref:Transposase (putative) gypsy type domain-containing protein n=1 Tax=Tagetes erecta TaxID=13708 RepID=A0AAD8KKR1_TARER|nr:hypothetical protein QVD17_20128 [Tagetes erecta]